MMVSSVADSGLVAAGSLVSTAIGSGWGDENPPEVRSRKILSRTIRAQIPPTIHPRRAGLRGFDDIRLAP
jgi:hypothetical protein